MSKLDLKVEQFKALEVLADSVDHLLSCIAEFEDDPAACSEHMQAVDDSLVAYKKLKCKETGHDFIFDPGFQISACTRCGTLQDQKVK